MEDSDLAEDQVQVEVVGFLLWFKVDDVVKIDERGHK